jgi:hydroxymethylpyrimidine pyrophosphatase-like HAD family hydrolase
MTNDVPMFAVAGYSICMGNGPPEVQARASDVTTGNDEDGFAAAVDRFVLPRRQ